MPISGRSPRQDTYSHPQPQAQEASAQGQSAPQPPLLQPQEQPWVVGVVSVIVDLHSGAGSRASSLVFIPADARPAGTITPLHCLTRGGPTPLAELRKAPLTNSSANAP